VDFIKLYYLFKHILFISSYSSVICYAILKSPKMVFIEFHNKLDRILKVKVCFI